jgi:hypothetical protein
MPTEHRITGHHLNAMTVDALPSAHEREGEKVGRRFGKRTTMTQRKAITRAELADDETATVLADALAGRRLNRRAARQLAATLRHG